MPDWTDFIGVQQLDGSVGLMYVGKGKKPEWHELDDESLRKLNFTEEQIKEVRETAPR